MCFRKQEICVLKWISVNREGGNSGHVRAKKRAELRLKIALILMKKGLLIRGYISSVYREMIYCRQAGKMVKVFEIKLKKGNGENFSVSLL